MKTFAVLLLASFAVVAFPTSADSAPAELLVAPGVRPGFVVHVGSTDGKATAALRLDERYLVHALSADPQEVTRVRSAITAAGAYGPVSADVCAMERLPYAPNIANVLIVEDFPARSKEGLTTAEIVRVLAPYGTVFLSGEPAAIEKLTPGKAPDGWTRFDKPYPAGMGEWRQPRCDASRAAISPDTVVAPPTALRWITGGHWTDDHGWAYMKMLSAGGRVFYKYNIEKSYQVQRQPGHLLIARDAFNGLKLWERTFPANSNWTMNFQMSTDGKRLYIPSLVLDAATGKDLGKSSLYRAVHTENIAVTTPGTIRAIDLKTGEELWRSPRSAYGVVIGEGKVFAQLYSVREGEKKVKRTVALDLKSGKELWSVLTVGSLHCYRNGLVLTSGMTRGKDGKSIGVNKALSAKDGKLLWSYEYDLPGHGGKAHAWFLGGLVWVHAGDNKQRYPKGETWRGLDPQTGEVVKTISMDKKVKHRCSPHRATEKYLLAGGMDFFDFNTGKVSSFHAARNACSFGYLPANGMLYSSTTVCMCFPHLRGIPAVAADPIPSVADMRAGSGPALEKGPAWGRKGALKVAAQDWPTLRGDMRRFGSTDAPLPAKLKQAWATTVSTKVSSPVVAGGLVFVAVPGEHRVVALDAASGQLRWSFTAGGPVDSPPTIHDGLALFGSSDGWVYALTADVGELVWRRRAAPEDKRIVARGHIESAWPVPGSVVVANGTLYCSAGRHSEVDGGIMLSALDPATGDVRWEQQIRRKEFHVQTSGGKVGNEMNDILSSDGKTLYMHLRQYSTADGEPTERTSTYLWGGPTGFAADISNPPYGWKHEEQRQWKYMHPNGRWSAKGTALSIYKNDAYILYNDIGEMFKNMNKNAFRALKDGAVAKEGRWRAKMPKGGRARAILVADGVIYVAGMPVATDPSRGDVRAYKTEDGHALGDAVVLPAAPRFDGMAAVSGRLFVCTVDGRVVCLTGR
jgi:outer membrane protein assembly factor BamB